MTRTRAQVYVRFLLTFAVLGTLGLGGALYVLAHQRATLPFGGAHTLKLQFAAANGLTEGIGQPVNVAGVRVGQVTHVSLDGGRALVTVQIEPDQVPRVYADATATLEPITPLQDMQIALNPGRPPARALRDGATLDVSRTSGPVPLSDLLSTLDGDTRTYLSSLLASLDDGTRRRGPDMRRMLLSLGPTVAQSGRISRALAQRRTHLARLVHNLALITRAASRDDQLTRVVQAGNQTLAAITRQDQPLRAAIAKLPATLAATRGTLSDLQPFARKLEPTLRALLPAVRRVPRTLASLRPFAETGARALHADVRPLVREAQPLLEAAGPAVARLNGATPPLTGAAQTFEYLLNEFAYNPPGSDEGFLFWFVWGFHNFNSFLSASDANGNIGRATRVVDCAGLQARPELQAALGVTGLCSK